ncbi:MAG: DHH family phosphoesterase [Nitrososphaeraceae archaeon]|nr:DHH family phosphoesterase [Nitrososphaeraceae archaeon]
MSTSTIVNFVLGISERPVYKLEDEIKSYIISIRGGDSCKVHLGRVVNQISAELGGSGGGHEKARGAEIPREKFNQFVNMSDGLVV